jgi:hypothetical protein
MTRAAKSTEGARKGYRPPRTGERRKCRMPLWIDKLPKEVRDEIIASREAGKTWKETAQIASAKAGRALPVTTMQRWYDLRIDQPKNDAAGIGASLREIIDLLKSILAAVKA